MADQAESAQAMADCLKGHGIETDVEGRVAVKGYASDFILVWPKLTSASHLVITPEGDEEMTGDYNPGTVDRSKPTLIDGDRDMTKEYVDCIESSGYSIPEPKTSSDSETGN
jgi:hypothetical protein